MQIDRGKCEGRNKKEPIHGMQCLPVRHTLANYLFWLNLRSYENFTYLF